MDGEGHERAPPETTRTQGGPSRFAIGKSEAVPVVLQWFVHLQAKCDRGGLPSNNWVIGSLRANILDRVIGSIPSVHQA